jgi:hypothetical protein
MSDTPLRLWKWLADMPTTAVRITVTLGIVIATAVKYLIKGIPGDGWGEWLTFLVVMSGLDAAQFAAKRMTFQPSPPASVDVEDAKAGSVAPNAPEGSVAISTPRPDLGVPDKGVV